MTPRNLSILVLVGLLALGGGWYFGTATKPTQQVTIEGGRLAFPDLTPKLKDVQRIEVVNLGKTTTITVKGGTGGLADRGGYPVVDTKLRSMLTALTELRLMEPRTADPEQLRRLGVEDPDAKDSKSTLLRLLDGQGNAIVTLITGHRRVRTQGKVAEQIYVRFPGEKQAWLAEGALQVDADPQLWLDRDVMNIETKRIAGVRVTVGNEVLAFSRKDDKLVLTEPAEHKPLDDYRVEDVARALEYLTFQDVQPDSAPVGAQVGQGDFVTSDGLRVSVSVFKAEKDILVRFAVSGDDSAKAEISRLSGKVSGWTYQLGGWKEKALTPTLADLVKAEEKPADPSPATTSPTDPVMSTPAVPAPTVSTPAASAPWMSAPASAVPAGSAPVMSTPAISTPATSAPATSAPVMSTPAPAPAMSAPVMSTPAVSAPAPAAPASSTGADPVQPAPATESPKP